ACVAPMLGSRIVGSSSPISHAASSTNTALSGTGGSAVLLSPSPTSITFGNVTIGSSTTQTVTLANSGSSSLTISQGTVSGTGYTISGLALPLTLAAGQKTACSAIFAPTTAGSITGTISLISNDSNSPATVP